MKELYRDDAGYGPSANVFIIRWQPNKRTNELRHKDVSRRSKSTTLFKSVSMRITKLSILSTFLVGPITIASVDKGANYLIIIKVVLIDIKNTDEICYLKINSMNNFLFLIMVIYIIYQKWSYNVYLIYFHF